MGCFVVLAGLLNFKTFFFNKLTQNQKINCIKLTKD